MPTRFFCVYFKQVMECEEVIDVWGDTAMVLAT